MGHKYSIPDDYWDEEDEDEPMPTTTIKKHEIEVVHTTDPSEDMGYGRDMWKAILDYEDGEPYVLYCIKYRWKGNYWRDIEDWEFADVPAPVRRQVAAVLPVDEPAALDTETRLMDEGGESRWEKHHHHRIQAMSGDEMWATSFLREAMDRAENAAEAADEGSEAARRADTIVTELQDAIEAIEDGDDDA